MSSKFLLLITGSAVGGFARYGFAGAVSRLTGPEFPFGTILVNLGGCFLIGALDVFAREKMRLNPQTEMLLIAGFCGAYTTFSTFMLETSRLLAVGKTSLAFTNVAVSITAGLLLLRVGAAVAKVF